MVAVWDFTSFWQFDILFCLVHDNHASVMSISIMSIKKINKANKDDKSDFFFKSMQFAKFIQAHAAFGWRICRLL